MFLFLLKTALDERNHIFQPFIDREEFLMTMSGFDVNLFEPYIRKNINFSLTRKPHQLIPSVRAHILLIYRVHGADESSKTICAIRPLLSSYSRFIDFLLKLTGVITNFVPYNYWKFRVNNLCFLIVPKSSELLFAPY
jgi:hypothetical protein